MLASPGFCRDRPGMDPLSDMLSLLKPRGYGFRGVDAGGAWCIPIPADEVVRCYAILSGGCRLDLDGAPPLALAAGDFVLLPHGQALRLGSGADAPPTDLDTLIALVGDGEVAVINGGGDVRGVGGYFEFESPYAALLLGALPPVVHFGAEADKAALLWFVERLMQELRAPRLGGALIAEHLVQTLLVEALRLHVAEAGAGTPGWLAALGDRRLRAAIGAMHAEPGRRWTLDALAAVAGMSRSSFADRFKASVGEPALAYLTRWRMMLAAERLGDGVSIAVVAPSLGYESESAFGAAFRRVTGESPGRFGRKARGSAPGPGQRLALGTRYSSSGFWG